jgi:pimeloyl-ACP methyl ester carboxylesterase
LTSSGSTALATTQVGEGPIQFIFCHGLFGQGRNWTTIARQLAPAASLLVDLPDHGRSPRTKHFSYDHLTAALTQLLVDLAASRATDPADLTLVGHSMGGRAAMLTALRHPELVPRLVVVDIGPAPTPDADSARYAAALQALDLTQIATRRDADHALAAPIPDPRVRGFLLSGLQPATNGHWAWLFNLDVLSRDLPNVLDWPDPGAVAPYPGPVLWLLGDRSTHVPASSHAPMRQLFPRLRLVTVKDAGHWVQADAPTVVSGALRQFSAVDLASTRSAN